MWQTTPYTIPLVAVILLGIVGGALTWHRGDSSAERWFTAVELAVSLWALGQLAIVSAATKPLKLFFLTAGMPLATVLPVTIVGFTLQYVGKGEWLTRRRLAALAAFPVVAIGVSLTNYLVPHSYVDPRLVTVGSHVELQFAFGPVSYGIAGVSWLFSLGCTLLLARKVSRSRNVYRKLSFMLAVTFLVMMAAHVASMLGFSPFPYMLLLPMTFLFFGAVAILTTTSVKFVHLLPVDRVLAAISGRFGDVVSLARDFVLEEIDAGVLVLDDEWRVVDINAAGKELLSHDRPVGHTIREVLDLSRVVESEELLGAMESDEEIESLTDELWVETDDDGERCYDVGLTTLRDRSGTVAGRVVLINDVTEQKRRERTLREREQELRQQKQSLQRQTTQLEHQNERLDRFASIVSHDLRNPLSVAEGNAELLDDAVSGEDRDRLESIRDAHERMEDIIDDALTLARQGKAITDVEPIDLGRVAQQAWENVDTHEATFDRDGTLRVHADRNRLLNLFENLFRNAVEHGGPTVTVRVGPIANADGRGFFVADDGEGIPDDQKEKVLDHGFTTESDGTGLGLSIVTDVAKGHGWTVDVVDSADGGTRFEFRGLDGGEADDESDDAEADPQPTTPTIDAPTEGL